MDKIKDIHIGTLIKAKVMERNMQVTEFAKRINCERTTVYNIFTRKSIDIEQLIRISQALEYDFINEVYFAKKSTLFQKEIICPYFPR
jgi:predicted transcriptional regulator